MLVRGEEGVRPGKQYNLMPCGGASGGGGGILDVQLLERDEAHVAYLLDGQVWTLQFIIGEVEVGDVPAEIISEHARAEIISCLVVVLGI